MKNAESSGLPCAALYLKQKASTLSSFFKTSKQKKPAWKESL